MGSLDSHPSRAPGSAEKGARPQELLSQWRMKDWHYKSLVRLGFERWPSRVIPERSKPSQARFGLWVTHSLLLRGMSARCRTKWPKRQAMYHSPKEIVVNCLAVMLSALPGWVPGVPRQIHQRTEEESGKLGGLSSASTNGFLGAGRNC